ncbi:MAG: GNAT family N-acetyltransferase [Candidatus Cloacimonetes bacterium]|nr:GNAT family N-acetyltransferase [Candidatus Cloacimonadota bacterium]
MENSLEIIKFTESYYIDIKKMLNKCFSNEYYLQLTEKQLEKIYNDLLRQYNSKDLFLDILLQKSIAKGFIIYQIDSPSSDWCEKEDWGFIREVYIVNELRKKGIGKKLVNHAERELLNLSVENIYITADDNKDFWIRLGYKETGEICQRNGGFIFIKKEEI